MFIGSKFCPHCGAAATAAAPAALSVLKCPRCAIDMSPVTIGNAQVRECNRCEGLWLDAAVFQSICADREQQSVILGDAVAGEHKREVVHEQPVRYIPCPHCKQLMNRINFAKCSDVIVDVCKQHGTWFDRDELREIIEFIRGGGMQLTREKLQHELEFQEEKLRGEQLRGGQNATFRMSSVTVSSYGFDDERLGGLSAARGLLKFLGE
ncbi:MAG TPA: zf-TFIIB domain-containing protein [Chthoniobacterales bacterium]